MTRLHCWAAVTLLAAAGCGPPPKTGIVTGAVTLGGRPLGGAVITFRATQPGGPVERVSGPVGADGTYAVAEVPLGRVLVTLEPLPFGVGEPGQPAARAKLPPRYADPAKSGLEMEVRPTEQRHDFELVP